MLGVKACNGIHATGVHSFTLGVPHRINGLRQSNTRISVAPGIETFDVAVIGVGGIGSAVLHHLSKSGCKVVGIESFHVGHDKGSSHGHTRIIRKSFMEAPEYTPLVCRSYELWKDLEEEAERDLLFITGGLGFGNIDPHVQGLKEHGLEYQILTGKDCSSEYRGISIPEEVPVLFQPDGGFLLSEDCIHSHCDTAMRNGAKVQSGSRVTGWQSNGAGVEITINQKKLYAQYLVIAAGPWVSACVPELKGALQVERQVLNWYGSKEPNLYNWKKFPVFVGSVTETSGTKYWYGTPSFQGSGLKIGKFHHLEQIVEADEIDRTISSEDVECMREFMNKYFPLAGHCPTKSSVCMFTNAPDGNFIIDWHPRNPQVIVCSPCSGHGFKFTAAIGEMVADMIVNDKKQTHEIFRIDRDSLTGKVKFPS